MTFTARPTRRGFFVAADGAAAAIPDMGADGNVPSMIFENAAVAPSEDDASETADPALLAGGGAVTGLLL